MSGKFKRKNEEEEDKSKKSKVETSSKDEETASADSKTILEALTIPLDSLKTNQDYEDCFTKMANFLLNKVVVKVNGEDYRLMEIEYYYTNHGKVDGKYLHHDPFTHGDPVQRQTAVWYFHKMGSGYKGGSYKGLDIAIGQDQDHVGGILIRSIRKLSDNSVVCGPSKTVDKILETCGAPGVKEMVDDTLKGDISCLSPADPKEKRALYLELKDLPQETVYRSGRVGLHMTKAKADVELQKEFVFKNYRYLITPKDVPKGAFYVVVALDWRGTSKEDIAKIVKTKASTIDNYTKLRQKGVALGPDAFVGKKMTDANVCEAYGSLESYLTW
eukprot:TRINITY_DN4650_c0_g4_i1.p1 TRINITY_DN4650_c0_g4~~TRINITY_DN4650_c0_g4_i1.p1  ORF type:complete len:330 (+),score=123.76 TRINITY_DN4650_c0_g4_i1:127-1116(+)